MLNQNIINVRSGDVLEVVVSENLPNEFFFKWDLRKDGQPDRRVRSHPLGIKNIAHCSEGHQVHSWNFVGSYAQVDANREEKASAIRANIARLSAVLEAMKVALLEVYAE